MDTAFYCKKMTPENSLSTQTNVSPMEKKTLIRKHKQYKLMIKTHLKRLLKKQKRVPNTFRKILITILIRKVFNRVRQTTTRGLSGLRRLLTSIGIKKVLHNVLNPWTLLRRIAKTPKSRNFLKLDIDVIGSATKALKHHGMQNLTNFQIVASKLKDLISNRKSLKDMSFCKVLQPWKMIKTFLKLLSTNSSDANKALQGALASCMMKVNDSLTLKKLSSSGIYCIVGVSTWLAVSLAIPLLVYSLKLANSDSTKSLLKACLQNVFTAFERLTAPMANRVSSYLHDFSPLTLSILSLVVPLLITAPVKIAKSPVTHQLVRIAIKEVIAPGVFCVGKLAVRALTCSTTRCIISSAARHVFAQVYTVLISTTVALFTSSTARNAIRSGITMLLDLPKSPFGRLPKDMLYSISAIAVQAVEVPISNAKLYLNLKSLSVDSLLDSSVIPVQVLFDFVGSLHAVGIDFKNQTLDGWLVPVLNSSKRVSQEMQSFSFSSLQALFRSLELLCSLCLFPKTLYGRRENVAKILQEFNIISIEDLTKPEVLTTCMEVVQNLMRPEVRVLLASAVCEMLPQPLRDLMSTHNVIYPLCDAHKEPAGSRVYLKAMIYTVFEVLMMPAVQKVLMPVLRDVIVPTVRLISSPAVNSIITNSRYFFPKSRIQRVLSSSGKVQQYLLSSPRLQTIMAPTYEIKRALSTAKDRLEIYTKTIKQ